jgi:CRP-like cAMP-binding protein
MTNSSIDQKTESNRILRALPPAVYKRLARFAEPVALSTGDVIERRGRPTTYVHFPQQGMLSLLVPMKNGQQVEAGTVGNEGVFGMGQFLEAVNLDFDTICQVPGNALRIALPVFKKEFDRDKDLRRLINRYSQSLMVQFIQGVACNRLHNVEQRCARWLLMTRDRVDSNTFCLTHEFLGQMLGVRRASVTTVAVKLQRSKLIHYNRGMIQIIDRKRLERLACECYHVMKSEADRVTR